MTQGFTDSLPTELVAHVKAGCGGPGYEWLEKLPALIGGLEDQWSVSVGEPFPGIEFNFVAPAIDRDGKGVVIKIAPPWDPVEIHGEAAYLRLRDGVGSVRLLAEAPESRAIMIEQIFPGRSFVEHFAGRESEAVAPAIDALKIVLRPLPDELTHITPVDSWFDSFRNKFKGSGFPEDYSKKALAIYDGLSDQSGYNFYLHGDYHPGNIVTEGESSYCVIDPKGWAGHIGYEIAVFLNNYHWWQESKADIQHRLEYAVGEFADAFHLSPIEVRQWAYAQMVIGAWWNFADMPELYDGSVVKADVWDV